MTVDSNHLRGLLAELDPTPLEFHEGFFNWYIVDDAMGTVYAEPDGAAFPEKDARAYVALRNNAAELLDRSDAFTEALMVIDRLLSGSHCWCGPEPECRDEPCGHCVATAFLARFPEEAT